jgi:hypothetical protein
MNNLELKVRSLDAIQSNASTIIDGNSILYIPSFNS